MMTIQINPGEVDVSDALYQRANEEVEDALDRFRDRITRVEVHLHDVNGPKAGVDKRCLMEARIGGLQPLAVEADGEDLYQAIHDAAAKLKRAVAHRLEKLDSARR